MSLNKSINEILQIKKTSNKCATHGVNLILCPAENCDGCKFKNICNNKQFCGSCADIVKDDGINLNAKIKQEELNPVLKDLTAITKLYDGLKENIKNGDSGLSLTEARNRLDKMRGRRDELREQKAGIKRRMF